MSELCSKIPILMVSNQMRLGLSIIKPARYHAPKVDLSYLLKAPTYMQDKSKIQNSIYLFVSK